MSALEIEVLLKEFKRMGIEALPKYEFHDWAYKGERRLRWIGSSDDLEITFRWKP